MNLQKIALSYIPALCRSYHCSSFLCSNNSRIPFIDSCTSDIHSPFMCRNNSDGPECRCSYCSPYLPLPSPLPSPAPSAFPSGSSDAPSRPIRPAQSSKSTVSLWFHSGRRGSQRHGDRWGVMCVCSALYGWMPEVDMLSIDIRLAIFAY